MANPDAPFGFMPWKHGGGGVGGRTNEYTLATAYGTSIFYGDLVKEVADGSIELAGEGEAFVGVFAGVNWIGADGSVHFSKMWTASTAEQSGTEIKALVFDDPNQLFLVQATGTIAEADKGQLADMDNAQAGNTTTGVSGQAIVTGGSEGGFRIVDVLHNRHKYPIRLANGNQGFAQAGANAYCVVQPLEHQRGNSASTEV